MNIANLTVNIRVLVGGRPVTLWRLRLLAIAARILRVQLDVKAGAL